MEIRSCLALLVLWAALAPSAWWAAQPGREYRIGYLSFPPLAESPSPPPTAILRALERLGYVHGRNLAIVYRSAEANMDMLAEVLGDLVDQKPDVIFAAGTPAALAARHATRTIPIVIFAADPVVNDIVASLARPGGNVTGVSGVQMRLSPKRLEILKETLPHASRVAVLLSQAHPSHTQELAAIQARAQELGLVLQPFDVTRLDDLQAAFVRMSANRPDAI